MALINCPECNNEISDKSVSCPHCGYPFKKLIKNEKKHKKIAFSFKKIILIISIIISIVSVIIFVLLFSGNLKLSEQEQLTLEASEMLKKTLLSPNSLIIYEAYANFDDEENPSIFINYGAKNGFGGISEGYVVVILNDSEGNKLYREYTEYEIEQLSKKSEELIKEGLFDEGFFITPDISALMSQLIIINAKQGVLDGTYEVVSLDKIKSKIEDN